MLPRGGRNWQLIYPDRNILVCVEEAKEAQALSLSQKFLHHL
jgi:hypothetical protein